MAPQDLLSAPHDAWLREAADHRAAGQHAAEELALKIAWYLYENPDGKPTDVIGITPQQNVE